MTRNPSKRDEVESTTLTFHSRIMWNPGRHPCGIRDAIAEGSSGILSAVTHEVLRGVPGRWYPVPPLKNVNESGGISLDVKPGLIPWRRVWSSARTELPEIPSARWVLNSPACRKNHNIISRYHLPVHKVPR